MSQSIEIVKQRVIVSEQQIVGFLREHPDLWDGFLDMGKAWCGAMERALTNHAVEADKNEVIQYIKTVESRLTTCVTDAGATVQDLVHQLPVKTGQQVLQPVSAYNMDISEQHTKRITLEGGSKRYVLPGSGDTCTLKIHGKIEKVLISALDSVIVVYNFVEDCDDLQLPVLLNLMAISVHNFYIDIVGSGWLETTFNLYHDRQYRLSLVRSPPFRHTILPFPLSQKYGREFYNKSYGNPAKEVTEAYLLFISKTDQVARKFSKSYS